MVGVVLIIIAMVLALPVAVMVAGAVWSALVGWLFRGDTPAESSRS
ncbi:MAG TPA: hypothetical protein VF152_08100 [Acidimicrobiia bacterium]